MFLRLGICFAHLVDHSYARISRRHGFARIPAQKPRASLTIAKLDEPPHLNLSAHDNQLLRKPYYIIIEE